MAVEANDIALRAEMIENIIAKAQLDNAIKLLLDFQRDFDFFKNFRKPAIILSENYNEWSMNKINNTVPRDILNRERNEIIDRMLNLISSIMEQPILQ